jgi:hypothetical protein
MDAAKIMEGDIVTVVFDSASRSWCQGRVAHTPYAMGDPWIIVTEDGTIYYVQTYVCIRVESRKIGGKA